MTINARIEAALASIGCPVGFQQLDDGAYVTVFPSVTYYCYLDQPEAWAEDEETAHGYYVQVDVWSKSNYMALVESAIVVMKAEGFGYLNGQDMMEAEGLIYHKALRFQYTEFI